MSAIQPSESWNNHSFEEVETYIKGDIGDLRDDLQNATEEINNRLDNCVDLTSEQTISATKTFSAGISLNNTRIRKVKTPTAKDDAANKEYIDNKIDDIPIKKGDGFQSMVQKIEGTFAFGQYSSAFGLETSASGNSAFAEGWQTKSKGVASHAEGVQTEANGNASHAEGVKSTASGRASHAEGTETKATNDSAHAEGYKTTAGRYQSHAEGNQTYADGVCSHTEGFKTQTTNKGEHAEGLSNISIEGKTVHTVGIGSAEDNVEDRKNAEEIHLNGDKYVYGIGGYNGTNSETEGIKTVQEVITESANAAQITYADLKSLRDTGNLVPGTQYRITDYTCTTTQTGTKSAGHVFDIIVTADDESTLNEVARAVKHDGDTYFGGCDLNAWKLWYSLDNDTSRFAWADEENGKGVIYRMIDEFDNDCPYDFKNIQFEHPEDTPVYPYYYYTFTSGNVRDNADNSLSIANNCYSNNIGERIYSGKRNLNRIVFIGNDCYGNSFGSSCYDNSFRGSCYGNSFGSNCHDNSFESSCYDNSFGFDCRRNSFGSSCYGNSFGSNCHDNSFESICSSNSFGNDCYSNTFEGGCCSNTFGNSCNYNTFGNSCEYNSFGNSCYSNTFEYYCRSNSFGNSCEYNSFGDNCWSNVLENYCCRNSFGNSCWSNSFGNSCNYNTFGKDCNYNSLGNECGEIKFASDSMGSTKYDFYQNNHFGDGCQYIVFKGIEGSSKNPTPVNPSITNSGSPTPEPPVGLNQVRKYNFAQGLQGTSSEYLTIEGVRGRVYETKVAKNSNGEIKIYCEADLIL